jgi:hypothetical protein
METTMMNTLHQDLARERSRFVAERAGTESLLNRLKTINRWQHRAETARRQAGRSSRRAEQRARKAVVASRRASLARDALA